jgi:hypothetical protein
MLNVTCSLRERQGGLAGLVAARSHTAFLDFFVDGPVARKANNFIDRLHYHSGVAREIENKIAIAIGN